MWGHHFFGVPKCCIRSPSHWLLWFWFPAIWYGKNVTPKTRQGLYTWYLYFKRYVLPATWVSTAYTYRSHLRKTFEPEKIPPLTNLHVSLGGGFKYFFFSPLLGEDSHFDYFSDGLKPPTSSVQQTKLLDVDLSEMASVNCSTKFHVVGSSWNHQKKTQKKHGVFYTLLPYGIYRILPKGCKKNGIYDMLGYLIK